MEMSSDNAQKRKESAFMDKSRDNDQNKFVYKLRNAAKKQSSTFFHWSNFQLPPFYLVHPRPYITTASLDKLTCTDYVDFGKCQDRFG